MADDAQRRGFLLPSGFLELKNWETPEEAARRKLDEQKAKNLIGAMKGFDLFAEDGRVLGPKKDGGLNGVVAAAVDESGNAIVAAVTGVDRLFAANPGDP